MINLIKTQRVLSKTQIQIADYVINPYRGCLFGCRYCYSSLNKTTRNKPWGTFLDVKANAVDVLEKELRHVQPQRVLIGSTTEVFQYPELRYNLTGRILELLNAKYIPYTILTRSDAVIHYLKLIKQNPQNKIYFTVGNPNELFRKAFEKNSPDFTRRLAVARQITEAGIALRLHISPVIPYCIDINDILIQVQGLTGEVGIEFYNAKMAPPGLFTQGLAALPSSLREKIAAVYANAQAYSAYFTAVEEQVRLMNNAFGFDLHFVFPSFDTYYSETVQYEQ